MCVPLCYGPLPLVVVLVFILVGVVVPLLVNVLPEQLVPVLFACIDVGK